ncbi:hypothetical protein BDW42DRAFT_8438 [Aspergillus taichungensis]|uniref:Mid2 domain-containing protein n=1 Tax=Aspergillus taichungensis TaxID=482145 RepID=A0A2J5HJD3_9EURO|nr:hypothetical protein BDW42DRAFT_8438 [Aspergillus taichungensis]
MSMSSPSIIFHQGLRCTKVPRRSAAVTSSTNLSTTSIALPDPTTSVDSSSTTVSSASTTSHATVPSDPETTEATETTEPTETPSPPPSGVDPTTTHPSQPVEGRHTATDGLTSSNDRGTQTTQASTFLAITAPPVTSAVGPPLATDSATLSASGSPPAPTSDGDSSQGLPAPSNSNSDDDAVQDSLRTLLGSVLGGVGFVLLVFLICLLLYRYRRRKTRGLWLDGSGEKRLLHPRESADSSTSLRHGYAHFVSNSSTPSLYHHFLGTLMSPGYVNSRPHIPSRHSDPFSDTGEVQSSRGSFNSLTDLLHDPFIDQLQTPIMPAARKDRSSHRTASSYLDPAQIESFQRPGIPHSTSDTSIPSSLGSTIILPGPHSAGSSLRRFSYHVGTTDAPTTTTTTTTTAAAPVTRVSTRSDPFDLEVPANVMHRRSSGVLPGLAV